MLDDVVETYEFREGRYREWPFWSMRQRNRVSGRVVVGDGHWARAHIFQSSLEFDWTTDTCRSARHEFGQDQVLYC